MYRILIVFLLVLSTSIIFPADRGQQFPQYTIKGLQYLIPVDNEEIVKKKLTLHIDARVPGFSTILKYTGKRRAIPAERKTKLDLLQKAGDLAHLIALYETEVEVTQDNKTYWLPIQTQTEEPFSQQIKAGEEFNALIRYVGCCYTHDLNQINQNRLYFLVGFDFDFDQRPKKAKCFSNELLGFRLGMPLKDALRAASKKFGEPKITKNASGGYILQFDISKSGSARLYIGAATVDYNRHVFMLQVSGTKLKDSLFSGVKLGDTLDAVKNLDRSKLKEEQPGVDQKTLFEEGSPCSLQTINDQITSVQIVEDFNFLSD